MKPRRQLPPLKALTAFEAVARHQSVARAAEELNLTRSAISQQLKVLEVWLGRPLFQRQANQLTLKPEATGFYQQCADALDQIDAATSKMQQNTRSQIISVTTVASFATLRLMPMLTTFRQQHPQISVAIDTRPLIVDMLAEGTELAIRYTATTDTPGLHFEKLIDDQLFPCASPMVVEQYGDELETLMQHLPLIDDHSAELEHIKPGWKRWFQGAGLDTQVLRDRQLLQFSDYQLGVATAIAGQGIILGRSSLAKPALQRGELVQLHSHQESSLAAFYLVTPAHLPIRPAVRELIDWLKRHIGSE